jgi:signal peptidase
VGSAEHLSRLRPALRLASLTYLYLVGFVVALVLVGLTFGLPPVAVSSGSMAPTMQPGDLLVVTPPPASIEPGAVITFRLPGLEAERLVTHRVIGVEADGSVLTKGDGNQAQDSTPVPPEAIVGVSRLAIPFVGLPVVWLEQERLVPLGIWLVVTLGAVFVVAPVRLGAGAITRQGPAARRNQLLRRVLLAELLAISLLVLHLVTPHSGPADPSDRPTATATVLAPRP